MRTQAEISRSCNEARVGSTLRVLCDSVLDAGTLVCRSEFESPEVDGEILVRVPDGTDAAALQGQFLTARITEADDYDLRAVLCGNPE